MCAVTRSSAECFKCGAPATDTFGGGYLCAGCQPDGDGTTRDDDTDLNQHSAGDDTGPLVKEVPAPLDTLGAVFVPIDPGARGARCPRTEDNLFAPDDDILEAYLEAGHNYGVACRDDLAVFDADEPDALADLVESLPETTWQISGNRSSEHYFLRVPGLEEDIPLVDPETGDNLGHIKAAPQSYVVGPGSRHPSGNRYGPLRGEQIATIDEANLRELVAPYRPDRTERRDEGSEARERRRAATRDDTPLDVRDVLTGYSEGVWTEHPFHGSETGANFMVDGDGETFRCWRHDCTGNALHLVGVEQGVIDCGEWAHGGLNTDTWREIFAAAREAGYDLLEFGASAAEQVAFLPPAVRDLSTSTSGWDWRHAAEQDRDALTIDNARERTVDIIVDAYESYDQVLIEALPTMGKSYGSIKAAAETDTQISVFTGRGRKEQYEQFSEWADEHGLTSNTLPAFTHDCATANGEHGQEWAERVRDWHRRGVTPKEIHKSAEYVLGRPLPCQEHEGQECPYTSEWRTAYEDANGEPYDVLIGHYNHAHNQKVTEGRVCVFDEFPDSAHETKLGAHLQGAVSYWLEATDGVPFDDYTDLLENRGDEQRRADALLWFDDHGIDPDEAHVFDDASAHASAPLAVFTIIAGDDLGNGFERADLDVGTGVRNRKNDSISIIRPPALEYTNGIVALDGTPTKEMWELSLSERLTHRPVLQDAERAEYVRDALNLNLVRTSEYLKPYNSADHVNTEGDAALLEAIREADGERPSLITTSTAKHEYDAEGVLELVEEMKHYGNVLGSNEFDDTRLGAVIGSNHYGDGYIKKWGAYAGKTVERNGEKGAALSYGAFGDRVLTHMREHDTLQAAMRFGRDGNGAVVYVHTDTLPEWVPLAGEGRVLTTCSDGIRRVLEVMEGLGSATTAEIVDHPDVDISRRQVFGHLEALRERGVLSREQDADDGRKVRWCDDGLHRVSEHGDVELEPVELDDLTDDEVAEIARSTSYYTWEFRNRAEDSSGSARPADASTQTTASGVGGGGDPPDR